MVFKILEDKRFSSIFPLKKIFNKFIERTDICYCVDFNINEVFLFYLIKSGTTLGFQDNFPARIIPNFKNLYQLF